MPDGSYFMSFWIDFELLCSVGVLTKKEWASLSKLIRPVKVVDDWFDKLANSMDFAIFKPVVNNYSFVALDDN